MIVVISALRVEIKGIKEQVPWVGEGGGVMVFTSGMGRNKAERAVSYLMEHHRVRALVNVGFAGALVPTLKTGDVVVVRAHKACLSGCPRFGSNRYTGHAELPEDSPLFPTRPTALSCDARLLSYAKELSVGLQLSEATCLTTDGLVWTVWRKRNLSLAYGAQVVDMESYWMCRAATEKNVPFVSLKVVLDELEVGFASLSFLASLRSRVALAQKNLSSIVGLLSSRLVEELG